MSGRVGVMHVVDALFAGGAERVAVELANRLPRDRYRAYLCTTREEGDLAPGIAADVGRMRLDRRWRFDLPALRRLARFVAAEDIAILHAHGPALFAATMAAMLRPRTRVVWHLHIGRYAAEDEGAGAYALLTRRAAGILAVSEQLAAWCRRKLAVRHDRIWYLRNAVALPDDCALVAPLPGEAGRRVVSVANFRAEKDQLTLVRAMARVVREAPDAHLLLVGQAVDPEYLQSVRREIESLALAGNVSILGTRTDVAAILRACDVGVLSSASEGLPLALAEYGAAGLASVATDVGQCAEVLDGGRAGLLVRARDDGALAEALTRLLARTDHRRALGERFRAHVDTRFGYPAMIERLTAAYDCVLGEDVPRTMAGAPAA